MTGWRSVLLLLALCQPAAAEPAGTVEAIVAGRRYAVPRALSPDATGVSLTQTFSLTLHWPGMTPVPPGRPASYADGVIGVLVQDISPGTRVEQLSALPEQRARFLTLWRDSTVDQFALPADFALAVLASSDTAEATGLGLRALGPLDAASAAEGLRLFSDGPPASLTVLMMCRAALSCQLWWMQDEAAVEVTFDERYLADWASLRRSVAALLTGMRAR